MDDTQKEALLREFSAYLETIDPQEEIDEGAAHPDLHTLLAELAALRTEVRTQARQFKSSLDQFREVFETLRTGYDTLESEAARRTTDQQTLRREVLRPLLLQILEVRDHVERGVNVTTNMPSPIWWCREERRILDSLRTGQEMSLRRLDQVMSSYQVRPIESLRRPHNPFTMTVVEAETRTDLEPGTVTEEVRRGFLWGEELLRPADVKVSRRNPETSSKVS
ncbi:molecular chaperone GrpE [Gammaproteobacteria bacterium]